jgi:hypothetical protein
MLKIILTSLAVSLGITLFIEVLLAFILGLRTKKDLLLVALCNVLTNPSVVFLSIMASLFLGKPLLILCTAVLELLAFVTEAVIYRSFLKAGRLHPFLLSFILNLASFLTGVVINNLGG